MRRKQGAPLTTWGLAKVFVVVHKGVRDWRVPSMLTKEIEAEQDQKMGVRRNGLKEVMKEREEKEKATIEEDPEPDLEPVLKAGPSIATGP